MQSLLELMVTQFIRDLTKSKSFYLGRIAKSNGRNFEYMSADCIRNSASKSEITATGVSDRVDSQAAAARKDI